MGYFKYWQSVGASAMQRSVDMPDFRLGVDKAENLKPIPIKQNPDLVEAKPVVENAQNQPYEKVAYNGLSDCVTDSMIDSGVDSISIWDAIEMARGEI